ncbi:MAG: DUF362 domain-containing protein [Actinomycetota bacterium]|nr:DUF362 domain-containing protein [Actinomycetota bacterium]MDD5667078.1 DUF362 domain-containing protein [Actinomycetota bacterium]
MAGKEKVLILEARYDAPLLEKRMREVLDAFPLELEGKSVLVKPNVLGPWPGESGVITHPMFVKAVVASLQERGARVQVGDNPGMRGYGRVGRVLKDTGLEEALGDDFVNITASPRRVPIRSRFVDETTVSAQVLDCDVLVSVPKFKTHVSTIITGAVKNSFGFLVGGEKARMHAVAPRHRDFGELMVDIYQLRVPDLVIMDAVTVMEGNGPSCEDIREEGKMLAARNGIALDTVMAYMMGIEPSRVPLLVTAGERGLGPVSMDDIEVQGPLERFRGFKQPSTVPRMAWTAPFQGLVFKLVSRHALRADPGRCTGCRTCEKGCPVGAIEVKDLPSFDAAKCINCYCCYELCPEHAIVLNRFIRLIQR